MDRLGKLRPDVLILFVCSPMEGSRISPVGIDGGSFSGGMRRRRLPLWIYRTALEHGLW